MIIDVHAHIFPQVQGLTSAGVTQGTGYGRITVGQETQQLLPPYNLIANLDWAGVDRAILLQGPFYGECNHYALDAIRLYPERLSGLAYLDPWDEAAPAMLDWVVNTGVFKGIKLECSEATGLIGIHPGAKLDSPENDWLWKVLEDRQLTLVLDLGKPGSSSYQTAAVAAIAAGHPAMKIVIAHLGQPGPQAEASSQLWRVWEEQIELGRRKNIWFDCAAIPAYLPDEDFPFPSVGKYLRLAIQRIGPHKVMWGSDQPGLLVHVDLPHLVKMMKHHLAYLLPHEQAWVMGETATLVFNLTPRATI